MLPSNLPEFSTYLDVYSPSLYEVVLIFLALTALALWLSWRFVRRKKTWAALLGGLALLTAWEGYLQWEIQKGVQDCIVRACTSAGLPVPCAPAEFGCTEWSGLSAFIFYALGGIALLVFGVGVGVMVAIRCRGEHVA